MIPIGRLFVGQHPVLAATSLRTKPVECITIAMRLMSFCIMSTICYKHGYLITEKNRWCQPPSVGLTSKASYAGGLAFFDEQGVIFWIKAGLSSCFLDLEISKWGRCNFAIEFATKRSDHNAGGVVSENISRCAEHVQNAIDTSDDGDTF